MKTSEFDKKFDVGKEDILEFLDLSAAKRLNKEQKRVNVDFPVWMINSLVHLLVWTSYWIGQFTAT